MLQIRAAQMNAFTKATGDQTIAALAEWLRENHPGAVAGLTPVQVRERVQMGLARAAVHGITLATGGVLPFVTFMFLSAPNFDDHPLARRTFEDSTIPPAERVIALAGRMTVEDWIAVDDHWDETLWPRPSEAESEEP
jgi:hypothetical protein